MWQGNHAQRDYRYVMDMFYIFCYSYPGQGRTLSFSDNATKLVLLSGRELQLGVTQLSETV